MVDQRERSNDPEEASRVAQDQHDQTFWKVMPVIVKEDSKGHTVSLRPAIKGLQKNDQGQLEPVEISYLGSCPVFFVQGGQKEKAFVITHPIAKDDEGIALFADRCLDGWWDKGDVQPEPYMRRHHLSDGMYLPGIRSCPRTLGGDQRQQQGGQQRAQNDSRPPSTSTIQIRTEKGDHYIELTGAEQSGSRAIDIIIPFAEQQANEGRPGPNVNIVCKRCNIKAEEKVHIDSPLVETTGEIKAKGEITAKWDVQPSQDFGIAQSRDAARIAALTPTPRAGEHVTLTQHIHPQPNDSSNDSEQDTNPPRPGT